MSRKIDRYNQFLNESFFDDIDDSENLKIVDDSEETTNKASESDKHIIFEVELTEDSIYIDIDDDSDLVAEELDGAISSNDLFYMKTVIERLLNNCIFIEEYYITITLRLQTYEHEIFKENIENKLSSSCKFIKDLVPAADILKYSKDAFCNIYISFDIQILFANDCEYYPFCLSMQNFVTSLYNLNSNKNWQVKADCLIPIEMHAMSKSKYRDEYLNYPMDIDTPNNLSNSKSSKKLNETTLNTLYFMFSGDTKKRGPSLGSIKAKRLKIEDAIQNFLDKTDLKIIKYGYSYDDFNDDDDRADCIRYQNEMLCIDLMIDNVSDIPIYMDDVLMQVGHYFCLNPNVQKYSRYVDICIRVYPQKPSKQIGTGNTKNSTMGLGGKDYYFYKQSFTVDGRKQKSFSRLFFYNGRGKNTAGNIYVMFPDANDELYKQSKFRLFDENDTAWINKYNHKERQNPIKKYFDEYEISRNTL